MKKNQLSLQARALWAKTSRENAELWLPLCMHMSDSAEVACKLWDTWVPNGTKRIITDSLQEVGGYSAAGALELAKKLFVFLAAAHDLGKATPIFQMGGTGWSWFAQQQGDLRVQVEGAGLPFPACLPDYRAAHALLSCIILLHEKSSKSSAVVLGGHHGRPPSTMMLQGNRTAVGDKKAGFDSAMWQNTQSELFAYAQDLAHISPDEQKVLQKDLSEAAQVILSGLVIMTDWLASDEGNFSLIQTTPIQRIDTPKERIELAWEVLCHSLPPAAEIRQVTTTPKLFENRFNFVPRPSQSAVLDALNNTTSPGILVIEASMGEGKTEAAFAAAEIMLQRSGRSGVFVALPTQATSDGLFGRVKNWTEAAFAQTRSINLAHGKARFNEEFQGIPVGKMHIEPDDFAKNSNVNHPQNVIVSDWFQGRKKGLLADVVVGTVDQILMAALRHKHLALRHLALANKVIIIDECHAYDAYMNRYLCRALEWLGFYNVPVIILSATLPAARRKELICAYLKTKRNFDAPKQEAVPWIDIPEIPADKEPWMSSRKYPLLTWSDNDEVRQLSPPLSGRSLRVNVNTLTDDKLLETVEALLSKGGCAGIIVNTVSRAQEIAQIFEERFGKECVQLVHSRFIAADRLQKETEIREILGPKGDRPTPPNKLIVIGTQVLEQSLDIDFDVLVSDLCPMDLLIQRIGRLHRHKGRNRLDKLQQAQCFVLGTNSDEGFERGSEAIYGKYILMNTVALLPDILCLPSDIADLVQDAYADGNAAAEEKYKGEYGEAKAAFEQMISNKESRADGFRIRRPGNRSLIDWLEAPADTADPTGKRAEASVRDSDDSIEVLVIQRTEGGLFRVLPWVPEVGGAEIPAMFVPPDIARVVAACSLTLPSPLNKPWLIDRAIDELEQMFIDGELPEDWQKSYWLEGELFLVLDANFETTICGYALRYDERYGLISERNEHSE